MFGPQGFATFAVLVLLFAAALYWLTRAGHVALKVVAGALAFVPAMMFGIVLVNKFYGYYESWDDALRDLTNQAPAHVAAVPDLGRRLNQVVAEAVNDKKARTDGFALQTVLAGTTSRIDREGIVYLPPQYFQRRYATRRFPVIELLHGSPGSPSDFEGRLQISEVLRHLISAGKAKPTVLVMPDTDGGLDRSTQCLDMPGREKDETYLAVDVPDLMAQRLRVQPPGPAWGVAGFSEGGYCAANLALRHPSRYGVAASLSGYFEPLRQNRTPQPVDPFAGDRRLQAANTPLKVLTQPRRFTRLPRFWVMAGQDVRADMVQAQAFVDLVKRFQPHVPFMVVRSGQHNYVAWRQAFPRMLTWATNRLWDAPSCRVGSHRPC